MNDFNFFLESQKKKGLSYNIPSMYLIVVVVLVICATISAWLYFDNMMTAQNIDSLKVDLLGVMAQSDYIEADNMQKSIEAMDQYDVSAQKVLTAFKKAQVIKSGLVYNLLKGVPTSVSVTAFSLDNNSFEMTCNAPNRKAASDLLLGLTNTGLCDSVTLNSVTNKAGVAGVVVSVAGTLKEGLK